MIKNKFTPTVNIKYLISGIYVVVVKITNGIATKKFLKEQ